MRHFIAGTAGHIDHGKTALVRALTGIDTDRLEEEKRRGISIDLGFAHLSLGPDLRVGFVDVPGHERFVKNMLAGVGGIDAVLLVVAADESIKPQTREHFDICRLLGIPLGLVALTKIDLVDRDIVDLVLLEVEEFAAGSFLEGAPVVPVSAATGEGLEELKRRLAELATGAAARDANRPARLPIDRAFALKGFGAVVTGTLTTGALGIEQDVEIFPSGRTARVRGLQVHGESVPRAVAGQRTAVNLSGIDHAELRRGMVLAEAGRFQVTSEVDCRFQLLATARPMKPRAPVHFHAGTAEIEAEARRLDAAGPLEPGGSAYLRFRLRDPALLLPGDRFIARMFSPVVTIGGGVVLDAEPPRRRAVERAARLATLEKGTPAERLKLVVRESPLGLSLRAAAARFGWTDKEAAGAAREAGVTLLGSPAEWLVDAETFAGFGSRLRELAAAFHKQNPLLPGIAREEARNRVLGGAPAFLLDAVLAANRDLAAEGEVLRLASHKLALRGDESEALAKIEGAFARAGLAVPSAREALAACGVDAARARSLLQILLRERKLIKVADDLLYHAAAIAELRIRLASRKGERLSVPEFKEWAGVSRKYAIPLLEYLDRERLTRREGDVRVVL